MARMSQTSPVGPNLEQPRRAKAPRPQAVLRVLEREMISPSLLRLALGGPGYVSLARNHHTDAYVKLLIPAADSGLTPPYDLDALRANSPELMPALRTYTVRAWDDEAQRIVLDLVLHDDGDHAGIASAWAASAQVGDAIAMKGAGGGYSPDPDAREHLLIGDHAALPAIAAALEAMPGHARGRALVHLEHAEDRLELAHPAGLELRWVIGAREQLLEEVRALELDVSAGIQVFCHAERGLTKQLRRHLVTERGIAREALSISAYWALGRIEDEFQAEKKQPIGRIDEDA